MIRFHSHPLSGALRRPASFVKKIKYINDILTQITLIFSPVELEMNGDIRLRNADIPTTRLDAIPGAITTGDRYGPRVKLATHYIYVYDGLPPLVSRTVGAGPFRLLA